MRGRKNDLQMTIALRTISSVIFLSILILAIEPNQKAIAQTTASYPGDLVITEFMANPDAVSDASGEYFELFNTTSQDINIDGYSIDDGGTPHTIDNGGTLTVAAESFIVIANSSDPAGDASVTPDYVFSLGLTNGGDNIIITNNDGVDVASLTYSSSSTGISHELDAISTGKDGITEFADYSESTTSLGSGGDLGSPGSAGNTDLTESPTVKFKEDELNSTESDASTTITIVIQDPDGSNSVSGELQFLDASSSGSTSDYSTSFSQSFSFASAAADGDQTTITLNINNDSDFEGTETFLLTFTNLSSGGSISTSNPDTLTINMTDDDTPNIVLAEVYSDPAADANGDGVTDTDSDEFIEIVNNEYEPIDISSWTLEDATSVRHTFDSGTIFPARGAIVIFDDTTGSATGYFGGALFFTASELSLNNASDQLVLKDDAGTVIFDSTYTGADIGEALTLNGTDSRSGSLTAHSTAGTGSYTPGLTKDGALYNEDLHVNGDTGWRMLAAPVGNWELTNLDDDLPLQGISDGNDLNIYTGYDGSAFVEPTALTNTLNSGEGFIVYAYNNNSGGSSKFPVTVDVNAGSEPGSDVTVSLHADGDKWNLVGNPFKTPIDVTAITTTGGSLSNSVGSIWDSESGSYILTSTNGDRVYPWQGFFIENTDATSITIPTSAKATGTGGRVYKSANEEKGYIHFQLSSADNSIKDLSSVIYFDEQSSHQWDAHDVQKLASLSANYTLMNFKGTRDGETISKSQDSRPIDLKQAVHIPVEFHTTLSHGMMNLTWDLNGGIPESWSIIFRDLETGKQYDLRATNKIQIPVTSAVQKRNKSQTPNKPGTSVAWSSEDDSRYEIIVSPDEVTAINNPSIENPNAIRLLPNYPNPFNPTTQITYFVPQQSHVKLAVYNVVGQMVAELERGLVAAGEHSVSWTATDIPSGIYIYQLEVGAKVFTRKMTLIK